MKKSLLWCLKGLLSNSPIFEFLNIKCCIKKRFAIFNGQLCQYSNCIEAFAVKGNSMPKITGHTGPIFEPFIAGFMPVPGSCLGLNEVLRTFMRQIYGLRFATVAKISFGPFIDIPEFVPQTTQSKDCDVWVTASAPRSIYPDNVSTLNCDSNFITNGRFLKLVGVPTLSRVPIVRWPAQKIRTVYSDFLF